MADSHFMLSVTDYVIFAVTICVSLSIGLYYGISGRGQKTTSEFLLGDRKMGYLPVSMSFAATFSSSIFFLGNPAEMYVYGVHQAFFSLGIFATAFLTISITIPMFHPIKVTSAYEYFELRFQSMAVRKMGSFFGILTNVLYMGIVLFGPAVALQAVTAIPFWVSVVAIGSASIIYTAVGGLKAVVWTDVFQTLVMVAGILAVVIKSIIVVGGPGRYWDFNRKYHRLDVSFNPDPTISRTFWAAFIGGTAKWFSFSFNENSVVRYVSLPTMSDARKMVMLSTLAAIVVGVMSYLEGFGAFAFYADKRCDPFVDGAISNTNQILPYFILELFHTLPGMPGLVLAALASASLSTLSSCLSSISACTLTDFILPILPRMNDFRATIIAKMTVVGFGCIAIGLPFIILYIEGPLTQVAVSILGAIDGPTCSMFLLGSLVPFANKYGALSGGIVGVVISMWVSLGSSFSEITTAVKLPPAPIDGCSSNTSVFNANLSNINFTSTGNLTSAWTSTETTDEQSALEKFYSLSYLYHALAGMIVTFVVGVIVSLLTGPTKPSEVNPKYLLPIVRRYCCRRYGKDNQISETNVSDEKTPSPPAVTDVEKY